MKGQSSSVPTRRPNSVITPTKSAFHYEQESTGHFVNLSTRILSDPRESVSVMTFNGETHQGMSISSVPCAVCIKALSSLFFLPWSLHNTNFVQTGLGNQRKTQKGGAFGREMHVKVMGFVNVFLFIEHDCFFFFLRMLNTSFITN